MATEITSSPVSQRMVAALQRMEAPEACIKFYREHVEADAVHEQVVRTEVINSVLSSEPTLAGDVVFGIRAWEVVEDRLAFRIMKAWTCQRSSLLRPLD